MFFKRRDESVISDILRTLMSWEKISFFFFISLGITEISQIPKFLCRELPFFTSGGGGWCKGKKALRKLCDPLSRLY